MKKKKRNLIFVKAFFSGSLNNIFLFACGVLFQTEADSWHRWFQSKLLQFWKTCNPPEIEFYVKRND